MQQYMLIGRVGGDVRYSNAGKIPYARISVADNTSYKDAQTGERKEFTTWIPVVAFGRRADFLRDYVHKGMLISITGEWRNQIYESNGEKRYSMVVRLKDFQFCDSKGKQETMQNQPSAQGMQGTTDDFSHAPEPELIPDSDADFMQATGNSPFGEGFTPTYVDDDTFGG